MKNFIILGTFDGVHIGHRALIQSAMAMAKTHDMRRLVLYFTFPPKFYFTGIKENCLLTAADEKQSLIEQCGCDSAEPLEFTAELAKMPAETFFAEYLVKCRNAGGIAAGADFSFGKNRECDILGLERLCHKYGLHFVKQDFMLHNGKKISSSLIRQMLSAGQAENAAACLGRHYSISGTVEHGAGIGRTMGFPTANIAAPKEKLLPPGVYAAITETLGAAYPSVAVIGCRPTLETLGCRIITESHLIGFSGDLYGKYVNLELCGKLRDERKFSSKDELIKQIADDKAAAEEYFNSLN